MFGSIWMCRVYWKVDSFFLVSIFLDFGETWGSSDLSQAAGTDSVPEPDSVHGMSKRNQQYFRTHTRENGLEPDLPCTEGLHLNQHTHTHREKGDLSQENHIYSQPRKKASLMQQLIMEREEKELSPMGPLNTRIRATEIVVVCKAMSIKGLC